MTAREEIKQYLVSLLGEVTDRNYEFEKNNFIYFSSTARDHAYFNNGCRYCIYFCSMFKPIYNEKDIEKLLNSGWGLYSKLCDVVDGSRYFRDRWMINTKLCRIDWKYNKCEDIYKQATGHTLGTIDVRKVVNYIEAIDKDVWEVSKALIKAFGDFTRSPVAYIKKDQEDIILIKKAKRKIKGGTIGHMLFSEDNTYKIKIDEYEDFIDALELLGILKA